MRSPPRDYLPRCLARAGRSRRRAWGGSAQARRDGNAFASLLSRRDFARVGHQADGALRTRIKRMRSMTLVEEPGAIVDGAPLPPGCYVLTEDGAALADR
eukprot:gene26118-47331_t